MSRRKQEDDDESNSSSESEHDDQPDKAQTDTLKQDTSKMTIEQLLKLKEKVGKHVFGQLLAAKDGHTTVSETSKRSRKNFKRENKNRPREMSSKRPSYDRTPVFAVKKNEEPRRDPRYEESSGQFDERIFDKSYEFLNDVRHKETRQLKKKLRKTKDDEEKEKLSYLVTRLENQDRMITAKVHKQEVADKLKVKVKETSGRQYINRGQLKKEELVEKFKNLKKTGGLDKYMEKKRKKNAGKDRKKLQF